MKVETTLRIDKVLYDALCRQAYKDNRSINSELCYIIKRYLELVKWNDKK